MRADICRFSGVLLFVVSLATPLGASYRPDGERVEEPSHEATSPRASPRLAMRHVVDLARCAIKP